MPTATTKPPTVPPSIERLLLLPLIALPILWLAGYFFPPINHDVAAILDVSARWVNGERLYVEVIDENLPLTFVVHALPVLTSKILPGDPSFWFTAWVVAGIFASFWACRRLVKLVPSADHALTEALLPPVLLFLFTVLPNEHFGQREHILFVACAPYMIASMARAEGILLGRGSSIAIGLVAGVALAMKPHYLAIPAALELYLLFRRGWRATLSDPIPWSIGLVAVAHFVSMYTIFHEYGTFVMPLAVEAYAPIGDAGWRGVLTSNVLGPTLLALVIFGLIAVIFTKTVAARVLVVFGIGAAISAIAQAKGWPYHVLPALSAAILLAALTVSQTVDRYLPISRSGHHLPVAVISATLMVLLYFQAALYTPPFYKQRQFEEFDRRAPAAHHRAERAQSHDHGAVARHLSAVAADQLHRRPHDHAVPHHVGAAGCLRDLRRLPRALQSARHDGRFREAGVRPGERGFRPRAARPADRRPHRRHPALPGQGVRLSRILHAEPGVRRCVRGLRAPDGFRSVSDLSTEEEVTAARPRHPERRRKARQAGWKQS